MLFDKTAILTVEERKSPLQTLKELRADYKLDELYEFISTMVEVCITTENAEYSDPIQRSDLLAQGRHLLKTIEASYLLVEQPST